jgi:hypothetical protein
MIESGCSIISVFAATFPVMLSLSQTDLTIHPGMSGRVEILFEG